MARDKLITVRIEGEKREAFNNLAKSQNTDTASLLYDFINQCLSGRIDISLVTGKGNRLDKIDNQLDSERIDKLETDTQRLDERVGSIAKKLADWVEAIDNRLNDSNQGLSEKMISLEHRLNALAIQLDSQQIDRIDTDSQKDRQGETPNMGTVATVETVYTVEAVTDTVESVDDNVETAINTVEAVDESGNSPLPNQENVETADEPVQPAIGPVTGDSSHLSNQLSEAVNIEKTRQGLTNAQLSEKTRVPVSTIEKWKGKVKIGEPIDSKKYPGFFKQWSLNLDNSLWYEIN